MRILYNLRKTPRAEGKRNEWNSNKNVKRRFDANKWHTGRRKGKNNKNSDPDLFRVVVHIYVCIYTHDTRGEASFTWNWTLIIICFFHFFPRSYIMYPSRGIYRMIL